MVGSKHFGNAKTTQEVFNFYKSAPTPINMVNALWALGGLCHCFTSHQKRGVRLSKDYKAMSGKLQNEMEGMTALALSKVAQALNQLEEKDTDLLSALGQALTKNLEKDAGLMKPQALSTTFFSITKLGIRDPNLLEILSSILLTHLDDDRFDSKCVANTLWAVATQHSLQDADQIVVEAGCDEIYP